VDWAELTQAQNKANLEQIEIQNSKVLKILQAKDEKLQDSERLNKKLKESINRLEKKCQE
jgi:hypothetical protein